MQDLSAEGKSSTAGTWIPKGPSPAESPHMSEDFARVYELTGNRVTAPIAVEALRRVAPLRAGVRVLDIAAGAGALSIPAAHSGASVLAVDIAPGMVKLLSERLAPFPNAEARVMDGQALAIDDHSFDLAFSIIGVGIFSNWRAGLREQSRVLRPGGKACVATWKTLPGGGPFTVMARAMRSVFPEQTPPVPPDGFVTLSHPARFATELQAAGFVDVEVAEVDAVWQGPAGHAHLDELHKLHRYMAPYAALDDNDRRKVDKAILQIVEDYAVSGQIRIVSPVLIAVASTRS